MKKIIAFGLAALCLTCSVATVSANSIQPRSTIEYDTKNTTQKFGSSGSLGYIAFHSQGKYNNSTGTVALVSRSTSKYPKAGSVLTTSERTVTYNGGMSVPWNYKGTVNGALLRSGIETHKY